MENLLAEMQRRVGHRRRQQEQQRAVTRRLQVGGAPLAQGSAPSAVLVALSHPVNLTGTAAGHRPGGQKVCQAVFWMPHRAAKDFLSAQPSRA